MRLSWASEEHLVWGLYFPNSRVRTHMTWQRCSVFLLDVRSSLRKKNMWSSKYWDVGRLQYFIKT